MEPTIYLNFNGNCEDAMRFYAEVLGGEVLGIFYNEAAPDAESRMPGGDKMVLNMAIRLGTATVMASDAPPQWYAKAEGFSVSLSPTSIAEFDRVYSALAEGARAVVMAPAETFWSERFAMFTDRFGTPWMLNFTGSKVMGAGNG